MSHVPYEMWVDYYGLILAQFDSHPTTLLDVCCGTGIVSELLARKGFWLTGFDLSPAMIAEARAKALRMGLEIDYHVADAATVQLGRSFDGAFSFFDSLNYITDRDRLDMAIRRVAAHLEPGAVFVFDVNTDYAFEQRMFDQQERSKKAKIRYDWVGDYNPATRIIRVSMSFERDGTAFHEVHVQRAHTFEEIMESLDRAGFGTVRAYDSYTLNPPRKRSDRLHFAAVLDGRSPRR